MDVGMDGRGLTHFHRSIERKMQHFVYLVVRRNGVWQFLEAAHSSGETIRQVRIRLTVAWPICSFVSLLSNTRTPSPKDGRAGAIKFR
jgi:hypothetical protein